MTEKVPFIVNMHEGPRTRGRCTCRLGASSSRVNACAAGRGAGTLRDGPSRHER